MSSETRSIVRDLVSYSSVILLSLIVFGTIWYLRAKFRKLLINSEVNTTSTSTSTLEQGHHDHDQFRQNYAANTSRSISQYRLHQAIAMERRISGQSQSDQYQPRSITPTTFDTGSFHSFPYESDSPPSYSSLAFPDVFVPLDYKGRVATPRMGSSLEKPPPYGSILVVKPVAVI